MATKRKFAKKSRLTSDQVIVKLEKSIPTVELEKLADISVFQESDGSYSLFNKYIIKKTNQGYLVTHKQLAESNICFYMLKHAVTWCTYDKRNRIMDSKRILDLDNQLTSLDSAIAIHQNLTKRTKNTDDKLIYLAKLGEEKVRRSRICKELEYYVVESKLWQAKRFGAKP